MTENMIRNSFPELTINVHGKPLVYLDSAASTLKCSPVIKAVEHHYRNEASNIHRGVHFLSEQGTMRYEATRDTVKSFIRAKNREEIIFTKGTTDSLNLVASSYAREFLREGDEILLTTMEHHSNIVPWQMAAEKIGAKIKVAPVNDKGEIQLEEYEKLLSEKTKIVSFVHISNTLGTVNPIKEMIDMAKNVGAKTVVDAAQSIAHTPIDVEKLDVDFLAFSGHKVFGPTGVGILYGKKELLEKMPPYQGGGDMIDEVTFEKTTYNDLPHKFEAGTPHICGVIALKAAIDFIDGIGFDFISERESTLLDYASEKMEKIDGLKILGTAKKKSCVISFTLDKVHPHDLGMLLDKQGVAIRTGHHCTQPLLKRFGVTSTSRASFSLYNTQEDVDRLVAGIKKSKEFFI